MKNFSQGDIVKIDGLNGRYLIISKNAFIKSTKAFHVCPILKDVKKGPLHIYVWGRKDTDGTVICEQLKLIDPDKRACTVVDSLPYDLIMDVSDAVQGMFEYE